MRITPDMLESRRRLGLSVEDHLHLINDGFMWHLVDRAREAALRASASYRPFPVGCALFAFNPKAYYYADVHKVFCAANTKLGKTQPKICAEQAAISVARAEGYELIIAMAIVANVQPDDHSGLITKTLHPCGDCRWSFVQLPEIHPGTRIITAHLDDDSIYEEFSVEELLKMHHKRCHEAPKGE